MFRVRKRTASYEMQDFETLLTLDKLDTLEVPPAINKSINITNEQNWCRILLIIFVIMLIFFDFIYNYS